MGKTKRRVRGVREDELIEAAGVARHVADYKRSAVIFSQGDAATTVMFIQKGTVKL
jgi:CRP-like cAMP-binding protein